MACLRFESVRFPHLVSFRLWSVEVPYYDRTTYDFTLLKDLARVSPELELCSFINRSWWRQRGHWTLETQPISESPAVESHIYYGHTLFAPPVARSSTA